jgi:hypothetical protein
MVALAVAGVDLLQVIRVILPIFLVSVDLNSHKFASFVGPPHAGPGWGVLYNKDITITY